VKLVTRELPLADCELKFAGDPSGARTFAGYASVWGRVDSYGDTIEPGTFRDSLKARMPLMFFGHNPGRTIGKYTVAAEDSRGLYVEGELTPGHSDAADVYASMKHGAISGLSIGGFTTKADALPNGGRLIRGFDLREISVVSMPAEDAARIDLGTVKQAIEACETIRDVERLLRDEAGLSNSQATAIVAKMRRMVRGELEAEARKGEDSGDLADIARRLDALSFPKSIRRS